LAEPIVQQLMLRDRIDETTIRHLLQETASARRGLQAEDDLDADETLRSRGPTGWLRSRQCERA
jgi:hypothetical protein